MHVSDIIMINVILKPIFIEESKHSFRSDEDIDESQILNGKVEQKSAHCTSPLSVGRPPAVKPLKLCGVPLAWHVYWCVWHQLLTSECWSSPGSEAFKPSLVELCGVPLARHVYGRVWRQVTDVYCVKVL